MDPHRYQSQKIQLSIDYWQLELLELELKSLVSEGVLGQTTLYE